MSDLAIKVENVSKAYTIWRDPAARLKHPFLDLAGELFPALRSRIDKKMEGLCTEFYALKDVSFEIKKGESVGIIGRNGSGKSTLLQIIAGTLQPTEGSVTVNGRVAALLELGSGFNPEFTGRENVYLNCSILGLTKEETDTRFQSIAEFADIGDFLEQPVKIYSSGMTIRLAFAVAINADPEILIVDEALSVGDELFQRKCHSRIESIRNNGTTILFVSHSGGQIIELCDRAILIDSGEKIASSLPKDVLAKYQQLLYAPEENYLEIRTSIIKSKNLMTLKGTSSELRNANTKCGVIDELFLPHLLSTSTVEYQSQGAIITNPKVITLDGNPVNILVSGKRYIYQYDIEFTQNSVNVRFGMLIKTVSGFELGGAVSAPNINSGRRYRKAEKTTASFHFNCNLNPGTYFLNAGVVSMSGDEEIYLHRLLDAYVIKVSHIVSNKVTGIVDFSCTYLESNFNAGHSV